jgi:hypothetical protein
VIQVRSDVLSLYPMNALGDRRIAARSSSGSIWTLP